SITTKKVTKEQLWKLFANVDNWATWDEGVDFAELQGKFEKGNFFTFKPKGGPKLKIELIEATENKSFTDFTKFPLAKMYGKHTFEETPEGLKITTTMSVEGILSFLWIKLVAQGIVDALPADMEKQIETAARL
ncbi:MAG: polyketide cyclase, partial [Chitinophagaceae bacterium]|nr:polyketide cyclase [Chitinophagaceae bacterium]